MSLGEDEAPGSEMGVLKRAWRSLWGRRGKLGGLRERNQAGTSAPGMGRRRAGGIIPLALWHPPDTDLGLPDKIQDTQLSECHIKNR